METVSSNYYFKELNTISERRASQRIRYQVYCLDKGWIKSDDCPRGLESDEYDKHAIQLGAFDHNSNLVGIMRIVQQTKKLPLPISYHPGFEGYIPKFTNTVELSRFIVNGQYDRPIIVKGLFRLAFNCCFSLKIDQMVIMVEYSLIRYFKKYNLKLKPLASPAYYFGGITVPAMLDVSEHYLIWEKYYSDFREFIKEGAAKIQNEPT